MSSFRDFVMSAFSDAMLPAFRQTFEDVIFEALNDRKVPTRTDFLELRDLVNRLRGQASSALNGNKKLEKRLEVMEAQLAALEGHTSSQATIIAAQAEVIAALEAASKQPTARKAAPRKRSTPAKKPAARKPAAKKPAAKKPAPKKPAAKKA